MRMFQNIILRLVIYYLAGFMAVFLFFRFFPEVLYAVALERARTTSTRMVTGGLWDSGADTGELLRQFPMDPEDLSSQDSDLRSDISPAIPVIVALVLAFLLTLPVVWVYHWTRPSKKYNPSFTHTLLVIPVAIALVVFVVKNSLALAFCLAGIVAAVRFRASLSQPMDAVYMLLAIGIGLASGTLLMMVAYVGSTIFVVIALAVWKVRFATRPAVVSGWTLQRPEEPPRLTDGNDPDTH